MLHAQHYANILIALGVWLGGVLMFGGFFFAEPLVAVLLGKGLSISEVRDLVLIVKIGLMQIPVVIVGILVKKLAIALGRSLRIAHSSGLALAVNLLLNFLLVPKFGILGVAIGALSGGTICLIVVLSGVYRRIGLSLQEISIAAACWFSWVSACVGLASGSIAVLVSGIISLRLKAQQQWMVLNPRYRTIQTTG